MNVWLKTHKWLGAILSPIMVVWFLSGIGMLFFSFPRLGNKGISHRDNIEGTLPALSQLYEQIPSNEQVKTLTLTTLEGQPVFNLTTDKSKYLLSADTLFTTVKSGVSFSYIQDIATRWSTFQIRQIDQLDRLDPWIPYSSLKKHFPIYRIKYDDPEKSYLYLSSKTGEALQHCTRRERIEASLSTIPHMLYFWQLRQDRSLWLIVISILSGASALMCLTGIIVGVRSYRISWKRRKKLQTPYQNRVFRLHHRFGMVFGFFSMMFALSGLLSLHELPSWLVRQHDTNIRSAVRQQDPIDLQLFSEDYRQLFSLGEVKKISFLQHGIKPYYKVTYKDTEQTFDATKATPTPLFLTPEEVTNRLSSFTSSALEIELLDAYDQYYVSNSGRSELPIYRVKASDKDKSWFYVSPTTGYTRYYSTNARVKKWIYPALHSLRTKYFAEHPNTRITAMLLLTLGGLVVSVTGLIMGYRFFARKIRHRSVK